MPIELSPRANEIVTCARALLAAGGYNGFSYADISASVKITKASIHHHFPNKADLVTRVLVQYRDEARQGLAALEENVTDPLGQLEAYTGYWAACIRDGTASFCICAMLAAELPALPEQVVAEVRRHFTDLAAWLASVLARGANEGIFRLQAGPDSEARTLMATVHGAMLAARAHGDPDAFPAIVRPLLAGLTGTRS